MQPGGREEEPSRTVTQPPGVQVYTLGSLRVVVGGHVLDDQAWRRRTARQLLKVLLSRPGRRMTRDEVIGLFWPDSDPDAASSNLRSTLYALRRALEQPNQPEVVFSDQRSVWLRPDGELWVDADIFEQKVAEAWRSPNPLPLLEEASALYVGDYLPDDLYEEWPVDRRQALKRTWAEVQFGLARALEVHSDVNAAMQPLERLLRSEPCDERAAQELMKLLARHGRRADALRVYQRLVRSMKEQLDVEPSSDSVELQRQISTGETVPSASTLAASFRCTYPFPEPAELIGRAPELAVLSQVLAAGRTAGKTALVAAPAGTGKSALLGQIVRDAQAQGVLCLAGGCYEERGAVPLGPFHDALVDYLLAQPPDNLRAEFGTTVEDLAHVIPEVRYHLQLTPGGAAESSTSVDRMRTFGAIHACLRRLAERGPVLVCLEDLHAADGATLQLLHYLARQTRRLPLVLIATYRSDEAPADQPLAQTVAAMTRERLAQRIRLDALGREATDRLVTALLEGSPSQALSDSLYATSGGNPLFVEQLVLALTEASQLQRKAGVWHSATQPRGTPQIVREVIAQRLQRLDPSCREVLAMASVLGQSFEHRVLLAAVEPLDEPTLLREVDRAIEAHVLQETPGGYAFRHALLRDAVYWDLSEPRRKLLHRQAAEVLERRTTTEVAQLAHHFFLAGTEPAVRAKALRYSLEAGNRAQALSSNRDALIHFQRAVQLLEDVPDEPRLDLYLQALQGRGHAQRNLGLWPAALSTLQSVLELTRAPAARARVLGELANGLIHVGDTETALTLLDEGLALQKELGRGRDSAAVRLYLLSQRATVFFLRGHYSQVRVIGDEMRAVADRVGEPLFTSWAHTVLSWAEMGSGQIAQAIEQCDQALSAAETAADKVWMAAAQVNLGLQFYLSGCFAAARDHLQNAVSIFGDAAGEQRLVNPLQLLGRVYIAEGDAEDARQAADTALALAEEQNERWAADCHDLLGAIHVFRCQWQDAQSNYEKALETHRRVGFTAGAVGSLIGIGLVHERRGDWPTAMERYGEAASLVQAMDPSPQGVAAYRHRGLLRMSKGEFDDGQRDIAAALHLSERMSDSLERAPSLLAAAEVASINGELDRAISLVETALSAPTTAEHRAQAFAVLASYCVAADRIERAAAHAAQALKIAARLQAPHVSGLAHLAAARLAATQGRSAEAKETFSAALREFERAEEPVEQAVVTRELSRYAQFLGGSSNAQPWRFKPNHGADDGVTDTAVPGTR